MRKIKHFLRISYLLFITRILNVIYKKPTVINDIETIDKIITDHMSVSRFGDGEIGIINGNELGFQKSNTNLATKLDRVLKSNEDNIMICIPDIYTIKSVMKLTYESKIFWLNELINNRKTWYSIPKDKTYYDACITRPYIRNKDKEHTKVLFDKLEKVWYMRDVVIVEGKYSRLGIGNDLFDGCRNISRILCPPKNAFEKYYEILEACCKIEKETLMLLSLGPTASILAYDLNLKGYQAFDLGHIDLEYEWFLQKSKGRVLINNKSINELNIDVNHDTFKDEIYEKQIIEIID